MANKQQFELEFDVKDNCFSKALKKGDFSVFFEINTPAKDCNLDTVISRLVACSSVLEKTDEFHTGFAITDKRCYSDRYNIVDFASELCTKDRDRHILFLSGRGTKPDEMLETIEACKHMGFPNIVPVSGEKLIDETLQGIRKVSFTESIDSLYSLTDKKLKTDKIFPGCVVNPFKYTPSDLFSQYYKLIKKLNLGANFIIAQAGWDLLKNQELRWYLEKRGFYDPSLARILFLKPELVESIISGNNHPGIRISPDFLNILRKESKFGLTQFMAAQWRKMQLYVAGLRFLGYSGVVVAGIGTAPETQTAIHYISKTLKEFKNFSDWKEAYFNYLGRSEMAPYPYKFYMFRDMLSDAYVNKPKENTANIPKCTKLEKIKYLAAKKLFSSSQEKSSHFLYLCKKILSGCAHCKAKNCYLTEMQFLCPYLCPKKLRNGPCGGTKANGNCECTNKECLHSKIFRLTNWKKENYRLEENYIPHL